MRLIDLREYCNEAIKKRPSLNNQIEEYYALAETEVEQGGSEIHEVELALADIDELLNEY